MKERRQEKRLTGMRILIIDRSSKTGLATDAAWEGKAINPGKDRPVRKN